MVFFSSLPIIRFGGFSLATWLFETHQLPYGARMFSVIFQFSSQVSLIELEGFFIKFSFFLMIPYLAELPSEEWGNCNNENFGVESSQSGSYMITIIQIVTLVSLTSTMTPQPVRLPLRATIPSLPTHSSLYALNFLCTRLPTHSSLYTLVPLLRLCTNRKNISLRYLSEIVHVSRHIVCHPRLL